MEQICDFLKPCYVHFSKGSISLMSSQSLVVFLKKKALKPSFIPIFLLKIPPLPQKSLLRPYESLLFGFKNPSFTLLEPLKNLKNPFRPKTSLFIRRPLSPRGLRFSALFLHMTETRDRWPQSLSPFHTIRHHFHPFSFISSFFPLRDGFATNGI